MEAEPHHCLGGHVFLFLLVQLRGFMCSRTSGGLMRLNPQR